MIPAQTHRIWQAMQNHQRPARTLDARIKDALAHMQASKRLCHSLRIMQLQRHHHVIEASRKAAIVDR